ncbi:hypothetical protein ACFL7M_04790, partial [Thermodesulfobacteriota bacterium]
LIRFVNLKQIVLLYSEGFLPKATPGFYPILIVITNSNGKPTRKKPGLPLIAVVQRLHDRVPR